MAKEDILGGLKNAVEKGENPQDAAQSFINAGYSEKEVNDALRELTKAVPKALDIPRRILMTDKQVSVPSPSAETIPLPTVEVKGKRNWLLIGIGVVGFVLLSVVATLLILLRQQ